MTIDVEGMELEVIKSNDWKSFCPKVLIIEILKNDSENIIYDEIYEFLKDKNYKFFGKTYNSFFFKMTK